MKDYPNFKTNNNLKAINNTIRTSKIKREFKNNKIHKK